MRLDILFKAMNLLLAVIVIIIFFQNGFVGLKYNPWRIIIFILIAANYACAVIYAYNMLALYKASTKGSVVFVLKDSFIITLFMLAALQLIFNFRTVINERLFFVYIISILICSFVFFFKNKNSYTNK